MKIQDRNNTLQLIELVLEERASAAQVAELESLVLQNDECLELYLSMVSLHGNLHWDAAGCGAEILADDLPQRLTNQSTKTNRRQSASVGLLSSAAVLAIACLLLFNPPSQQPDLTVAQNSSTSNQPEGSNGSGTSNAEKEGNSQPVEIVGVRLPLHHTTNDEPTEAIVEAVVEGDKSGFTLGSDDAQMVAFINKKLKSRWEEHTVSPSPPASDAEWVRRVHLDLAGRIPTTLEVETFLESNAPNKREQLLQSLLESRDFAGNFASLWTTLLVGRSADREIDREALFSYLQRQFGNNDPWSDTVKDLIAAEGPAHQSGPANFLLAHLNNEAVPATAITSRILLCQQLQCSQCHTHPTAKGWGQDKFWEFNAFFQRTSIKEQMLVDQETGEAQRIRELVDQAAESNKPSFYEDLKGVMKVAYPKFAGVEIEPKKDLSLREQLAELLTSGEDTQLAQAFVNRNWRHFFGHAFTRQVDDMGPHTPTSHPELLDGVSQAFVNSGYDVKRLFTWICLSDAYNLSSVFIAANNVDAPDEGELPLFTRMYIKPLSPEQIFNSLMIAAGVTPEELHRRGTSYAQRQSWLQQFFTVIENEENTELSTFDGSLPQTLMMMNGELVQQAVDPVRGAVFKEIISDRNKSEIDRINEICLAALSRYPSKEELAGIRKLIRSQVRQMTTTRNIPPQIAYNEALRDVYWAYLNSSEFTVNR